MSHEIGHTFGLDDCTYCAAGTSAMTLATSMNDNTSGRDNPSACDSLTALPHYSTPPPPPGGCNGFPDWVQFPSTGCAPGFINNGEICTRSSGFINQCERFSGYEPDSCGCSGGCEESGGCSPIIVDILGDGFSLTNAANGVNFDLNNDGQSELRGWTVTNTDDAWLVLDRNDDGTIDGGRELFGNATPQEPPSDGEELNGFRALAMYDDLGYGGNGDGKITRNDAIFNRLRLWQDANHNGISETCELFPLPLLGLSKIDLDYRRSKRVDEFGNQFRYRAKVRDTQGAELGRWAWDVYLVTSP